VRKARLSADPGFYINVDACVNAALAISPRNRSALQLRSLALMNDHRFSAARDVAKAVLTDEPTDAISLGVMSDALLELGHYADARSQYQKASTVDPSNGIAAKNLARLTKLVEETPDAPATAMHSKQVDPSLFIEESGWVLRQQQALDGPHAHELIFEAHRQDFSRPSAEEMLRDVGLTPRDVAGVIERVDSKRRGE